MKTHSPSRFLRLGVLCFLTFVATAFAGTFSGHVSDLDAGNGRLTVTSDADQTSKEFRVNAETVIVGLDGKPSQLMNLIEKTRVEVQADPGVGDLATKITVLADTNQQVP
jgi:hypothetical protein